MSNIRINSAFSTCPAWDTYATKATVQDPDALHTSDTFTSQMPTSQVKKPDISNIAKILAEPSSTFKFTPAWSFSPPDQSRQDTSACPPIISTDGSTLVGHGGTIYRIDNATGLSQNFLQLNDEVTDINQDRDGNLYACTGFPEGSLKAFDAKNAPLWEFNPDDGRFLDTAISPDGKLIIGATNTGKIIALDTKTGLEKWEKKFSEYPGNAPVFDPDRNSLYLGCRDGGVYSLNMETGDQIWKTDTRGFLSAPPAVGKDGTIYLNNWKGKVFALNPEDGSKKWEFTMKTSGGRSPAIDAEGIVYTADESGIVYALDPDKGAPKWEKQLKINATSNYIGPTVLPDNSVLITGTSDIDSTMFVLNGETGKIRAQLADDDFLALPPAVSKNAVSITSRTGKTLGFKFASPPTIEEINKAAALQAALSAINSPLTIIINPTYTDIGGARLNHRRQKL